MISVCMATYNGARFIKEQIDSILPQLGAGDELIISDDGSTDGTLDIIDSYNDVRIKVLHHERNPVFAKIKYSRNFYYASSNFENALRHAKGDYIFLSDQDDVWAQNKVSRIVQELQCSAAALSNSVVIDSDGKELNSFWKRKPFKNSVFMNLGQTPFLGCCMAFRHSVLSYLLPFTKSLICHDLWIGCLCASRNQLSYIDEPLHKYRVHGNNLSPSITLQSKNPLWFRLWYRFRFVGQFLLRKLKMKIKGGTV